MRLKGLIDEDFINYKTPSMYIATSTCTFKCDKESNGKWCQNSALATQKTITLDDEMIINRYLSNGITHAIVLAGLEPMDTFDEVLAFTKTLRKKFKCKDDLVIYTGYTKDEVEDQVSQLQQYENIVMKYGRFLPNFDKHFDKVLGVYLASPNQYGERIS